MIYLLLILKVRSLDEGYKRLLGRSALLSDIHVVVVVVALLIKLALGWFSVIVYVQVGEPAIELGSEVIQKASFWSNAETIHPE